MEAAGVGKSKYPAVQHTKKQESLRAVNFEAVSPWGSSADAEKRLAAKLPRMHCIGK